jgi:hypothetical protein
MNAPQTQEWGPALWRLMHTLSERVGFCGVKLHEDEKRAWIGFFSSLKFSLPCPVCRNHYREYLKKNPVESLFNSVGESRRVGLRKWLWDFHNTVNEFKENKNGNGNGVDFEDLVKIYGTFNNETFIQDRGVYIDHMKRGMFLRWIIRDDMMKTVNYIDQLKRVLL